MPSSGPSANDIANPSPDTSAIEAAYVLVELDQERAAMLGGGGPRLSGSFPDKRPSPVQTISIGDTVQVAIFEASNNGLFSTQSGSNGGGSKSVTLPPQSVEADGHINVPYAGKVTAAGRTPTAVSASIVSALGGKAIDPQAIVTVQQSKGNLATVTGQVRQAGRVPLTARGDRLLDVISNAGGPDGKPNDLFIQLTRGGRTAKSTFNAVVSNPSENVYIWPNDTIYVFSDPQSFTAFGATGTSGNFPFEFDRLSVAEAVGAAKGLNDNRADPAGVFIFRTERKELVCRMVEHTLCKTDAATLPTIYRINLRDPLGVFHAKQMTVRNKDLLYIANAETAELLKFLRLLSAGLSATKSAVQTGHTF